MVSVIIPTYNAGSSLPLLLKKLREQTLEHELIIIDSESSDNTSEIVNSEGAIFIPIKKSTFNHGATRNLGVRTARSEIVVFLTQDALPVANDTLEQLVTMLHSREDIAMVYGRQLPNEDAGIFGRFARLTNYPHQSVIKTKAMIPEMGIKTCSCSNSFSAYRKNDLMAVGEFPTDTILGEDVSVAARFILLGKAVAYSAQAKVYHSHDYNLLEEFKRYFDIGVFHKQQSAVLSKFSKAESEGFKYVIQEWQYLSKHGYTRLIPVQLVRTLMKYAGYRLGTYQTYIPTFIKRALSMHRSFWDK